MNDDITLNCSEHALQYTLHSHNQTGLGMLYITLSEKKNKLFYVHFQWITFSEFNDPLRSQLLFSIIIIERMQLHLDVNRLERIHLHTE